MKVSIDGVVHNRCNLCTEDAPEGESYCKRDTENCLDDCSKALDEIVMTYDTDLAYECMTKILEGRR